MAVPQTEVSSDHDINIPIEHAYSYAWLQTPQEALPPTRLMKVMQVNIQCPVCKIHTPSFFTVHSTAANQYRTHTQHSYIVAARNILCSLPHYSIAYIFIAFW